MSISCSNFEKWPCRLPFGLDPVGLSSNLPRSYEVLLKMLSINLPKCDRYRKAFKRLSLEAVSIWNFLIIVTRLGYFWKVVAVNFLTQVAQAFENILGYF